MKIRCSSLDHSACTMMGMSGVEVYECRIGYTPADHFYDIVWGGKRRWSISPPWDVNKHELVEVGRNLRYRANMDEQFERVLRQREDAEEKQKLQNEDDNSVLEREVKRTVFDKPLYFY